MKSMNYDIIPDIHGYHGKLLALLDNLGYRRHGGTHRHPEGRKVVFLGDFIDRGPEIREVLHTVRGMVDAGDAHAIMGNHEYNAICYATPDGKGGYLKDRAKESYTGTTCRPSACSTAGRTSGRSGSPGSSACRCSSTSATSALSTPAGTSGESVN